MIRRRREVLLGVGAAVIAASSFPAPAIMQGIKELHRIGAEVDMDLGLHKAANYYYYPGFHEPGSSATLGINKTLWDGRSTAERALIEAAAQAETTRSLAELNAENLKALRVLRADPRIKILRFSDALIREFGRFSKEVIANTASKDPLTRKVADSYMAFLAGTMDWGELSETELPEHSATGTQLERTR